MPGAPRLPDALSGVRVRTTAATTLVVAVALLAGAYLLVMAQRSLGLDQVDKAITARAGDLELLLGREGEADALEVARGEEALVQIVDGDGRVVAASENAAGLSPVAEPGSAGIETVPGLPIDPDEEFRLLAEQVPTPDGPLTIVVAGSLDALNENVEILVGNLAIALPLLLALVTVATWLVVGRALQPVEAIRAEVESIGGRHLERRVPEPRSQDEVGRLARTMNAMLARLQHAWDRQEQFVADASHELRSPLTAMRSQLEVDGEHPDTADVEATREHLLAEVGRMQGLIDDLLYLARGEAGAREHRTVDLDDLVLGEARRVRSRVGPPIDTSGVSAGQVRGHPGDLRRLVSNLLDNAARHAHSSVTVSLREEDHGVVLSVADDGPGIPPEERDAVFERFVRLDDARSHGGGSGLGLAIARDVVERHGGAITFVDTDSGARVEVRLPGGGATD